MNTETRKKFFAETELRLFSEGFQTEMREDDSLLVRKENIPVCKIRDIGVVAYRQAEPPSPEMEKAKDRVYDIVSVVAEYVKQMEQAPPLCAIGLEDGFKLLADFNGTVLAGKESSNGVQFVTWDWDYNRKGLSHGHYFLNNYEEAKEDFALRSGLIEKQRLFSIEELTEIYRSVDLTLETEYSITAQREKMLQNIVERIQQFIPDLDDRVFQSHQDEIAEHSAQVEFLMNQQI